MSTIKLRTFLNRRMCYLLSICIGTLLLMGCKKDWLDAKPDVALLVPATIQDYQAILDNTANNTGLAGGFNTLQPAIGEIATTDFYMTDDVTNGRSEMEQNAYMWKSEIYTEPDAAAEDWTLPYKKIFVANLILEGIEKILTKDNSDLIGWNQVKGSALFFRAYNHFCISQLYCKVYD
ncbi:MAG: RagB/SusD family nutrient uptake outer membrane protein, partial [Chitinophagaceae bacterium]